MATAGAQTLADEVLTCPRALATLTNVPAILSWEVFYSGASSYRVPRRSHVFRISWVPSSTMLGGTSQSQNTTASRGDNFLH